MYLTIYLAHIPHNFVIQFADIPPHMNFFCDEEHIFTEIPKSPIQAPYYMVVTLRYTSMVAAL